MKAYAESVAKHLGTEHNTINLTYNEILDEVQNISNIFSEPFADYLRSLSFSL